MCASQTADKAAGRLDRDRAEVCQRPASASRALPASSKLQVIIARRGVSQEGEATYRTPTPTTGAALVALGDLYISLGAIPLPARRQDCRMDGRG